MRRNVALLRAEIRDELARIERLDAEFDAAASRVALDSVEPIPNYDRAAVGYLLHSFYNGCENIFRLIAGFFENDLVSPVWHRDLLRRMLLDVEGYRPRVIDEDLFRLLDDFRAFRHRFRHSYSFELDWERERLVVAKYRKASALLRSQVEGFLSKLDELERDGR